MVYQFFIENDILHLSIKKYIILFKKDISDLRIIFTRLSMKELIIPLYIPFSKPFNFYLKRFYEQY